MNFNINSFENDLKKLEQYLNTHKGLNLDSNIFKILKIDDFEIRHSNFLKWLFDLTNNFDVASKFTFEFFKHIDACINPSLLESEKDVDQVVREDENIDLMVKLNKHKKVLVIENKIYSTESNDQLSRYYNIISNQEDLKDYKKYFVYLTLNGDEPLLQFDKEHWIVMSHKTVKQILSKIIKQNNFNNKVTTLLKDYIDILKEKTEDNMDKIESYHKLYQRHKNILCDISKYVPQITYRADIEKNFLKKNPSFELLTKNANTYLEFSISQVEETLKNNNLASQLIIGCLSNEPYDKLLFTFIMTKTNGIYKKFVADFKEHFKLKVTPQKNGSFVHVYTKTLLSLKDADGAYKTEKEFQDGITIVLNDYFQNPDSEYFEMLSYIQNYNFGE